MTLTQTLSKPIVRVGSYADRLLWVFFFTLVTAETAYVYIPLPFTPVPITLQTFAVVASGVVLGKDGKWSQLLYLLLGGFGLPFFAKGSGGFADLLGPTGGYLIGFVAVSAIAGKWFPPIWSTLSYWGKTWRLFLVSLIVFAPGVLQLCLIAKINVWQGLQLGFFPFVLGDLVKTLFVALLPNSILRKY